MVFSVWFMKRILSFVLIKEEEEEYGYKDNYFLILF